MKFKLGETQKLKNVYMYKNRSSVQLGVNRRNFFLFLSFRRRSYTSLNIHCLYGNARRILFMCMEWDILGNTTRIWRGKYFWGTNIYQLHLLDKLGISGVDFEYLRIFFVGYYMKFLM